MRNKVTILIVDDDPSNLLFQKKLLEKNIENTNLIFSDCGAKALADIKDQYIDLIILDVELPDFDGFELFKRIEAMYPERNIPVIYLSGFTENIYIKKGFELGAVDYLTKPIDANLYVNRIRLYLQLLSNNKEIQALHDTSQKTLDLVNRYVISSKADLKGTITEVTDAFCKISGYTRDELIGKPHNIVRHPDMSPDFFKELWETIKSGKTWSGDVKNLKKNGDFYWVYAVITPMFDDNGVITGYYSTRQDITAEKEKAIHAKALASERMQRQEAEKEAKEILESTDSLVIVGNINECTYANKAFLDFFDVATLDEFKEKFVSVERYFIKEKGFFSKDQTDEGKSWFETVKDRESEGHMVKMQRFGHANESHSFVIKVKRLNSNLKRYLIIFDDVTELESQRSFFEEAATHDQLTGVYNRFFFRDTLVRAQAAAKRYDDYFSIIILDLDKFKSVNDTYGHLEGDNVLQKVSKVIQDRVRDSDIFARWGGEEFILLLPSTDADEAYEVAEDLRKGIEQLIFDKVGTVTCSFGVTHWIKGDNDASLIKRADDALYEAKEKGRNRVVKSVP